MLTRDGIKELLIVTMKNVYLEYDEQIFLQIQGLPMGSSVSPILAIMFMDTLEKQALLSTNRVGFYGRYIDDIFVLTKNSNSAEDFRHIMERQCPHIKFEIELPTVEETRLKLKLLDIEVCINQGNSPTFEFYKKSARKDVFVNFNSALPMEQKMHILENERRRIRERCSSEDTRAKHEEVFNQLLRLNNYPESIIRKSKHQTKINRSHTKENKETFYHLRMPFVTDTLNKKLKNIFKKENIPVRFYHTTRTLRQALSLPQTKPCHLQNCPMVNKKHCTAKNVVYKVLCNVCKKFYIGSTIRELHQRMYEHTHNKNSSLFKHMRECGKHDSSFTTSILARDRDAINIRMKEALLIQMYQPAINSKEELSECLLI
jgi:hypothetical protein